jgi:hypothetical protein
MNTPEKRDQTFDLRPERRGGVISMIESHAKNFLFNFGQELHILLPCVECHPNG